MTTNNVYAGRERSKYNSLKGGLSIAHALPCIESCMYKSICPAYAILVHGYQEQTFISTCALEAAQYLHLKERYSTNPRFEKIDETLLDELIMLDIRLERIRRYISLYPDLTSPDKRISKAYTLLERLQKKLFKILQRILNIK